MRSVAIAWAALTLSAIPASGSFARALGPGDAPPPIEVPDLAGNEVDLRALTGSVVVVDFWASWCDPCKEAMPVLESLHRRHAKEGLVIVGVNIDNSARKMNRFLERQPVSFRIVHDRKLAVASKYKPPEMPSTYFIGRDGKLQHVHAGFKKGDPAKLESQLETLLAQPKPK